MRLWELEGGDGDDVGHGYAGGVQVAPEAVEILEEEEPGELPEGLVDNLIPQGHPFPRDMINEQMQIRGLNPEGIRPPAQELQREGPLVLRINQVVPPPAPAAPAVPDPPPARGNRQRRGGPNQRIIDPRPAGIRAAAPLGGRRLRAGQQAGRGAGRAEAAAQGQEAQDAAHQAWVQMFVQMALNDEEDQLDWDSDDEEDAAAWEIPVR